MGFMLFLLVSEYPVIMVVVADFKNDANNAYFIANDIVEESPEL